MAITTTTMKNHLADRYGDEGLYLSLHTADPTTVGDNEVAGGSPAYARQPITWGTPTSSTSTTAILDFDVPASTAITHVGIWSAVTAGTYLDKAAHAYASTPAQGVLRLHLFYVQS